MCTVSVIMHPGIAGLESHEEPGAESPQLLRIVCNRDEKRIRSEALPPVCRQFGARTAILPIDPLSRGTWIAVNDAGLALCLLNATVHGAQESASTGRTRVVKSRGEIIPSLLDCETVEQAIAAADGLEARDFPPFRLIAASRTHIGVLASDQNCIRVQQLRPFRGPFMATSSSLGDERVDLIRRELFAECLRESGSEVEAQHRFHSHQWPDRKHLSVLMARPDARTVSRTIVEIGIDCVRMVYHSLTEVKSPTDASKSLTLELAPAPSEAIP